MAPVTQPSPTMMNILRLMHEGWELGRSKAYPERGAWLQLGGLGRGGPVKNINGSTFYALVHHKLIRELANHKSRELYALTHVACNLLRSPDEKEGVATRA